MKSPIARGALVLSFASLSFLFVGHFDLALAESATVSASDVAVHLGRLFAGNPEDTPPKRGTTITLNSAGEFSPYSDSDTEWGTARIDPMSDWRRNAISFRRPIPDRSRALKPREVKIFTRKDEPNPEGDRPSNYLVVWYLNFGDNNTRTVRVEPRDDHFALRFRMQQSSGDARALITAECRQLAMEKRDASDADDCVSHAIYWNQPVIEARIEPYVLRDGGEGRVGFRARDVKFLGGLQSSHAAPGCDAELDEFCAAIKRKWILREAEDSLGPKIAAGINERLIQSIVALQMIGPLEDLGVPGGNAKSVHMADGNITIDMEP